MNLFPRRRNTRQRPVQPAPPRPLAVQGVPVPLELRESARTRRLTLRVDAARGLIQVVVPPGLPEAEIHRFVGRHADWVRQRAAKMPLPIPFTDGAAVPIHGIPHRIHHNPLHKGAPVAVDGVLTVGGGVEFLARRVRDHLIRLARNDIAARARTKAAEIGAVVAGVTLRDTRSRWGSCSSAGKLSFSWRLIMAPEAVLDYVVAHEVAHLREMNHSPRFWAICAKLTAEVAVPRAWLKSHGSSLFRYGVTAD